MQCIITIQKMVNVYASITFNHILDCNDFSEYMDLQTPLNMLLSILSVCLRNDEVMLFEEHAQPHSAPLLANSKTGIQED